ncbi:MAG TPA: twin-arginine translocase TatA/TatE family subunit [Candidatus Sulfotelmatobacter sp.]|jgi:TatA/E family protein of Tat protein translocase|nr:twin-arginine translocase TatA/TatE family subunit [Candidatus Sulfotelmatobacter sp.]
MLSLPHLVVLFVIALVIFGPQKLPELARMLGKATAEFRKMTNDFRYALEDEVRELDRQNRIREEQSAAAARAAAEAAKAPPPAPSPELAAPPEGAVARSIPETTVTATVEPPATETSHDTSRMANENPDSPHPETEAVSVHHEKPADDHAA